MLTLTNTDLPSRLMRLPQPPEQLYVEGDLAPLLTQPCIGIVGSRKLTPYGRQVTAKLAFELAQRGVVIVSGLALGVDSVAHQAALDAGGCTIAVLPSGLDSVYPVTHRQLARTIVERGGALVSEYPADTFVMNHNFIARNRIIAGLSSALLVTEAALKSGSLHTARFALELGKDVLAVPGNISSPTSEGTNNLIRAGAGVVTCTEDVLRALKIDSSPQTHLVVGDTTAEQTIIDLLAAGVSDGAALQVGSQLPIEEYSQALTMLEITGKIRATGGNTWSL